MGMPEHHLIAQYWDSPQGYARIPSEFHVNSFVHDLGEPSCFACHWYPEAAPCYPKVTIRRAWEVSRLDRAHLTPRALGGSETVDNLVLICRACHREAPNVRDPRAMLSWMVRRPSRNLWVQLNQKANAVAAELRALGVDMEDILTLIGEKGSWPSPRDLGDGQAEPRPDDPSATRYFRALYGHFRQNTSTYWGEPHGNAATLAWPMAQAFQASQDLEAV